MKTTSLAFALCLTLAATSSIAEEAKEAKPAKDSRKAQVQTETTRQDDKTLLTGSFTKQKVRRNGMVTDSANQVLVLDSETINNSGASDLKQLLVRRGIR